MSIGWFVESNHTPLKEYDTVRGHKLRGCRLGLGPTQAVAQRNLLAQGPTHSDPNMDCLRGNSAPLLKIVLTHIGAIIDNTP